LLSADDVPDLIRGLTAMLGVVIPLACLIGGTIAILCAN
jgi:hypothetical protein